MDLENIFEDGLGPGSELLYLHFEFVSMSLIYPGYQFLSQTNVIRVCSYPLLGVIPRVILSTIHCTFLRDGDEEYYLYQGF